MIRRVALGAAMLVISAAACAFHLTAGETAELPACQSTDRLAATCTACQAGDAAACLRFASALGRGEQRIRVDTRAAELAAARACELGSDEGCIRATVIPPDIVAAEALHRRAVQACRDAAARCTGGSADACALVSRCEQTPPRTSETSPGAARARQCAEGHGDVCRVGAVARKDRDGAAALLRRECTADDSPGCERLAGASTLGIGVPADLGEAANMFARLCEDTGSFTACAAVDGHLELQWLIVARGLQGAPAPTMAYPDLTDAAALGVRGDHDAIIGFCVAADGSTRGAKALQSWGDERVDALLIRSVAAWQFPGPQRLEHPCYWISFRMRFR